MSVVHKKEEDDIEMVINMTNRNKQNNNDKNRIPNKKGYRKNSKRDLRIKTFSMWIGLALLLIIGIIFALTSPLFNITEIRVVNNNVLSEEKVESLSGLTKEQNIFRFLEVDVEKRIKEEPYVESVKVSRDLPGTVVIDVTERNRDFCVKFLNGYAYINNQGYILEITQENIGLPVLLGVETPEEKIVPGGRLINSDLKKLETSIQIMSIARENSIDSKITSIDISNKNEYILHLEEEKKTVYLGNGSDLPTRILYVKEIMEKYETGKEGTIFVNGDFSKQFKAYFREKV